MGWVSNFLSTAVLSGFILGFALGIIVSQVHDLLGVPGVDGSYRQVLIGTVKAIPDTDALTLVVGLGALGLLLLMRRFRPRWPRALVVVALTIMVTTAFNLEDQGLKVTGHVPTGLFSIGLAGCSVGRARCPPRRCPFRDLRWFL